MTWIMMRWPGVPPSSAKIASWYSLDPLVSTSHNKELTKIIASNLSLQMRLAYLAYR